MPGGKNGGSRPTTDVVTHMSLWWHCTRNEKWRVRENCSRILEADSTTAKVYWTIRRRRSTETIIVTILITVSFVPINYRGTLLPIHRSNKALRKSQHNVLNKTGIADDYCKYEILVLDGRIFRLAALLGWTALDHDELIWNLAAARFHFLPLIHAFFLSCVLTVRFFLFYQFGLLSKRYSLFVLSLIFTLRRIRASQPCH